MIQRYISVDGKIFATEVEAAHYNLSTGARILTEMNVKELRSLCMERGAYWRGLNKAQLIASLLNQPPVFDNVY
jgi:hypothetical protein